MYMVFKTRHISIRVCNFTLFCVYGKYHHPVGTFLFKNFINLHFFREENMQIIISDFANFSRIYIRIYRNKTFITKKNTLKETALYEYSHLTQ